MATGTSRRPLGPDLADWERRLAGPPAPGSFGIAEVEGLPPPVQRHLTSAVSPGTALITAVRLTMRGSIKLGSRWLPFRAREVLNPHAGFVWAARVAGLVVGSDQYVDGAGAMDWRLAGLLRVAHADGPDVSRSSAGRAGVEAMWVPTSLLPRFAVRWSAADESRISVGHTVGSTPVELHYDLRPDGHIASVVFDRWGDPDGSGSFGWHRFGGWLDEHRTFGGLTVPSAGRLGWHFGTDRWSAGEFFHYEITHLEPLPR